MNQLWQNARCCGRTYQRWTLAGRPQRGGMAACLECGKELQYVDSTGAKRRPEDERADPSLPHCGGEKSKAIDMGLEICARHCEFGKPLTQRQIAAFCGCTPALIFQVEKRALRKIRRALDRIKQERELKQQFEELVDRRAA